MDEGLIVMVLRAAIVIRLASRFPGADEILGRIDMMAQNACSPDKRYLIKP